MIILSEREREREGEVEEDLLDDKIVSGVMKIIWAVTASVMQLTSYRWVLKRQISIIWRVQVQGNLTIRSLP